MPVTGEEIRARLTAFAARWSVYEGTERAEAQTFLNQLFACYGTDREAVALFEERGEGGYPDLIWPGVCLVEMKAPVEAKRLNRHRDQAIRYWGSSADSARGSWGRTRLVRIGHAARAWSTSSPTTAWSSLLFHHRIGRAKHLSM